MSNRLILTRYFGGKSSKINDILPYIPHTKLYVEPFFGMGGIFFNKRPMSDINILNDLDRNIYNLFKVIRERPQELIEQVSLTPHSRTEYDKAYEYVHREGDKDELEWARCALCVLEMGFQHSLGVKCGFSSDWFELRNKFCNKQVRRIPVISELLQDNVIFENIDAVELIERAVSKPENYDCFMYLDPPYVKDKRVHGGYGIDDMDHEKMLAVVQKTPHKVMISGYECELYDDLLNGWHRLEFETWAFTDWQRESRNKRTEVLWYNYETVTDRQQLISI